MELRRHHQIALWVMFLMVVGSALGAGVGTTTESPVTRTQPPNSSSTATDDPTTNDTLPTESDTNPDLEGGFRIPDPDHGVDPAVFRRLWSGDIDEADADAEGSVRSVLLDARDYAFDRPPEAVETWNDGDHGDFPRTDIDRSIYPPNADRADALWIEDAYIQVFAVQPSTILHVSATDTRQYVRREGTVLGTTDYRIGLPPDVHREFNPPAPDPGETVLLEKHVVYRLIDHEMSEITLEADGDPIATTGPTHTPRLEFSSLDGSIEQLSLTVTIGASFEKTTRRKYRSAHEDCETRTITVGNETKTVTDCDVEYNTHWSTDVDTPSREVTVRDSVDVTVYDLSPTASRTVLADGQSALAVNQSSGDPWTSYQVPGAGSVHNRWHFYSARNRQWDSLIEATETGTTPRRSVAIPLQVHAFPSGGGAYATSGFGDLEVTHVWGSEREPPTLPDFITLPVVDEPYSTGSVVVIRSDSQINLKGDLQVQGLVRGTETSTSIRTVRTEQATSLDLELLALNRSAGTVTVRLTLEEAETGQPIDLRSRPGHVEVHGVAVETNASGTAVATVPIAGSFVSAEYQPGPWWATDPVYESTRGSVDLPSNWPDPRQLVTAGATLLTWLSPLLLVVLLIDRLLGRGRLWPPWRGLQ